MKIHSRVIAWGMQGVYLTTWATVGIVVWIPQLLGAWMLYFLSLVTCVLKGTSTRGARRHLRGATAAYGRFVGAMESARARGTGASADTGRQRRPLRSLGVTAWSILVWYVILWPAGVIHVTPGELASSLASILGQLPG
jgi:hypothetical protein